MLLPLFVTLFNLLFDYQEAEIIFAGDAMQHQAQLDAARSAGNGVYDYSACFDDVSALILGADYAVVNLETPLASSGFSGYPCFCSPVSFASSLRDAGFNLFLTANNHTLDRRDRGLRSTLECLDSLGVNHIGTYTSSVARQESLPFVESIAGIKVAFLNYTYGTNGITVSGDAVVDYIDRDKIQCDVRAARDAGADILCVAVHWGDEYRMIQNRSQSELADWLVAQGVDLIIGSHPHVVQPMEVRHDDATGKDALVVYSLGNFISNMKTRDTRGGAIVRVRLVKDSLGARFESASYDLVFTVPPSDGCKNFRVVVPENYDGAWRDACASFLRSARSVFDSRNVNVPRSEHLRLY